MLSVRNLGVRFLVDAGEVSAVRDVSWDVYPGEVLGIVGESGSGKSASVASLLGLLPAPPAIVSGSAFFGGRDLLSSSQREWQRIRGREIAMIFQDPTVAFNPVRTIGNQISEAIRVHDRLLTRKGARRRAIDLLEMVGMSSPKVRYSQFPHEYSGGMRQRAMIAMAMANRPRLIIADEPTTALDVTIQAQILELLELVQQETEAATILITHDLGLIAELADRVLVMYAGRIAESADVLPLFQQPKHPYTLGLLASLPRIETEMDRLLSIPGQPPSLISPPSGCAFHPRCRLSRDREKCRAQQPDLVQVGPSQEHRAACHYFDEMDREVEAVSDQVGADVRVRVE